MHTAGGSVGSETEMKERLTCKKGKERNFLEGKTAKPTNQILNVLRLVKQELRSVKKK